jgi:hypothetical protein
MAQPAIKGKIQLTVSQIMAMSGSTTIFPFNAMPPPLSPGRQLPGFTERVAPLLSFLVLAPWICRSAIGSPSLHVPRPLDGRFHVVGQDDKLRWSAVINGADAHYVDFSHNAPQNSRKSREEQEASCAMKTPEQTRKEIEQKMDEVAGQYVETHDQKIIDQLYELGRELEKVEKLEKQ